MLFETLSLKPLDVDAPTRKQQNSITMTSNSYGDIMSLKYGCMPREADLSNGKHFKLFKYMSQISIFV